MNDARAVIAANLASIVARVGHRRHEGPRRSPAGPPPAAHRDRHGRGDGRRAGRARAPLQRRVRRAADDRGTARPSSRGRMCRPRTGRPAEALLDASFFRDLAVMADCQDVIRELAARHDVFIATAAMDVPVLVRREVSVAPGAFPVHPAVPLRLLRRQERHRRRLSHRRPVAAFRHVQGAAAAVLGAAQRRGDPVSAGRVVGGGSRAVREGGWRPRRRARRGAILPLAAAARTKPVICQGPCEGSAAS